MKNQRNETAKEKSTEYLKTVEVFGKIEQNERIDLNVIKRNQLELLAQLVKETMDIEIEYFNDNMYNGGPKFPRHVTMRRDEVLKGELFEEQKETAKKNSMQKMKKKSKKENEEDEEEEDEEDEEIITEKLTLNARQCVKIFGVEKFIGNVRKKMNGGE